MIFPFVAGELPISKEGSNGSDFPPYIEACARCSTWHGRSGDAFWMSICTHSFRSHNLAGKGWALAWQMLADLDLDFVRFLGCWTQLNHHNHPVFLETLMARWWSVLSFPARHFAPHVGTGHAPPYARCWQEFDASSPRTGMHLGHSRMLVHHRSS